MIDVQTGLVFKVDGVNYTTPREAAFRLLRMSQFSNIVATDILALREVIERVYSALDVAEVAASQHKL